MFGRLRRLNDALPGLVVGILLYGVLLELVGVWFVDDKAAYSIGLWYGIAIAVGMAVNMATVIFDSTFEDTDGRMNYRVLAKSLLRYVVVVVLFAVLAVFRFGYVIAAFLGVMGLKASAYMQPLFQKIEIRMGWREPDPELIVENGAEDSGRQCNNRRNCRRRRSCSDRRNRGRRSYGDRRNRGSKRECQSRRIHSNRRDCLSRRTRGNRRDC